MKLGDYVRKIGGNYEATGYVLSIFTTTQGKTRVVFEFEAFPGMLHIFTPEQLELVDESVAAGSK